jgi:hypothetical protein
MAIHVAHWIWSLSIGGDAKNLSSLVAAQRRWANITVMTRQSMPGVAAHHLETSGIQVVPGIDSAEQLSQWLDVAKPSVLIFHRNGRPDATESSLLRVLKEARVPCFEYNTFARVDPGTDALWTGHLHLSRTSMMQYAMRRAVSPLHIPEHAAIGYAVDIPPQISEQERLAARKVLGIAPDRFVALRLVRPDLRKWDPLPVLAVGRLIKKKMPVHLLIRAAPARRENWVRSQCGNWQTLLQPSFDPEQIRLSLAASNCLLNYSHIGETFGLALAEAMAAGLPTIVNCTPDMDNAQIELCQHESTGLVANTLSSLVSALQLIFEHPEIGEQMGRSGRSFIEKTFANEIVELRLRRFMIDRLRASGSQLAETIPEATGSDSYSLDQSWLDEYKRRLGNACKPTGSWFTEIADRETLRFLRLFDTAEYALNIGPAATIHLVKHRIGRGSLMRR